MITGSSLTENTGLCGPGTPISLTLVDLFCNSSFTKTLLPFQQNVLHTINPLYFKSNPPSSTHFRPPTEATGLWTTVNVGLYYNLQPLDSPSDSALTPFGVFSSAFNTIAPTLPRDKLSKRSPPLIKSIILLLIIIIVVIIVNKKKKIILCFVSVFVSV